MECCHGNKFCTNNQCKLCLFPEPRENVCFVLMSAICSLMMGFQFCKRGVTVTECLFLSTFTKMYSLRSRSFEEASSVEQMDATFCKFPFSSVKSKIMHGSVTSQILLSHAMKMKGEQLAFAKTFRSKPKLTKTIVISSVL